MAGIIEKSYKIENAEHGTKRIVQHGRCSADAATVEQIERDCCIGELRTLPHSKGAVYVSLDGGNPLVEEIRPPTVAKTYRCVKVSGRCWPFAPTQTGGVFEGTAVLQYEIVWQEVGDVR